MPKPKTMNRKGTRIVMFLVRLTPVVWIEPGMKKDPDQETWRMPVAQIPLDLEESFYLFSAQ